MSISKIEREKRRDLCRLTYRVKVAHVNILIFVITRIQVTFAGTKFKAEYARALTWYYLTHAEGIDAKLECLKQRDSGAMVKQNNSL